MNETNLYLTDHAQSLRRVNADLADDLLSLVKWNEWASGIFAPCPECGARMAVKDPVPCSEKAFAVFKCTNKKCGEMEVR